MRIVIHNCIAIQKNFMVLRGENKRLTNANIALLASSVPTIGTILED